MSLYYPSFSGAISGGATSLVTDFLEIQFGNSQKKMDDVMLDALKETAKGMLFDLTLEYIPSSIGEYYRYASSESSYYLNKVGTSGSFSNRRNAFYRYAENVASTSAATRIAEKIYKVIGYLCYTISTII